MPTRARQTPKASFTRTGKKQISFFASVHFFANTLKKIGRIEIGKFLSVRPIFSVLEKLDGSKKTDGCKK
jgi:hypothetical protein